MRKRLSLLVALIACAAPKPQPPRGVEVFRVEGRVENAPFRFGREDLPSLPRRAFESVDGTGQGPLRRYDGVAVDALLVDRMEVKREADTAVVRGDGGIAVPVPLAVLRQLRPVLADSVDGDPVSRRGDEPISLLLAWPVSDHPGVETDPRLRWWWVRGVRRIEVTSWVDTYGRALQVPAGAPDAARLGADLVAAQCIGCHSVRGTGGTRGQALTDGGIDARLRHHPSALAAHLQQMSGNAAAPAITPRDASQMAAFLEAVRVAGPTTEPTTTPSPPPPADEGPTAEPPIGEPPIGGRPAGR